MDRYWFLTSTTYGTWLPGDARGFVGYHPDDSGRRVIHNRYGELQDRDMPELDRAARARLKCDPIHLAREQAQAIVRQFQETAAHRGWLLLVAAVMRSHFHLVVGVEGDPDPERVLGDFKSYASRTLNRRWGKPASGTWWTTSGSKRRLRDEASVAEAVSYVTDQEAPLVAWLNPEYATVLADRRRRS